MRRSSRLQGQEPEAPKDESKVKVIPVAKKEPKALTCPLETITIGVDYLPSSDEAIEECLVKAAKMHRGNKLGCGEQGCTFSITEDPKHVIKVTKLTNDKDRKMWKQEACVGIELGNLGIAPAIPKVFECGSYGYILMDILKDAKKLPDGTVIREKDDSSIDHMKRMPAEIQLGFIKVLAKMIDHGFIHMDNHIENLGFIGTKPVVFDFGFTQRRTFSNEDKFWALSFSLFQILEHCPLSEMMCGPLWDVATAILRNDGAVKWNSWSSAKGMSMEELQKNYPKPKKDTLKLIKVTANAISKNNADCIVGAMAYAIVMQTDIPLRYDVEPFYDVIYNVRTGKKL
jgi:hypothetical protein